MNLAITNVIDISVATPQKGVGAYNTSNLALFTREAFAPSFGSLGYSIYLGPNQVATDFGTASNTFAMANAVFSQQPNILLPGGYLVVIPFLPSETMAEAIVRTQNLIQYFGILAAEITSPTNGLAAAAVVEPLNALAFWPSQLETDIEVGGWLSQLSTGGLTQNRALYYGSTAVTAVQNISFPSVPASGNWTLNYGAEATSSLAFNAPATGGSSVQSALEALAGLSTVTVSGDYTTGFTVTFTGVDGPATLLTVTPNTLMNSVPAPVIPVVTNQVTGISAEAATTSCLVNAACYAGRALSTDFTGSLTTQTMHLKSLSGDQPDPTMTQTILNLAVAAGSDSYVSIAGVPKVFTSGANDYFDNQYNLQWFAGALQVAYFNYLAEVDTKVPQTEQGMDGIKNALRAVCEQGITNGFIAAGAWTSPTTFGNQASLIANVAQRGYYIYSVPVALQNPAVRATRAAPLVQIAIKYAGAIQSGTVIVNINP